jgi:hypothetical protein
MTDQAMKMTTVTMSMRFIMLLLLRKAALEGGQLCHVSFNASSILNASRIVGA